MSRAKEPSGFVMVPGMGVGVNLRPSASSRCSSSSKRALRAATRAAASSQCCSTTVKGWKLAASFAARASCSAWRRRSFFSEICLKSSGSRVEAAISFGTNL